MAQRHESLAAVAISALAAAVAGACLYHSRADSDAGTDAAAAAALDACYDAGATVSTELSAVREGNAAP